MNKQKQKNQWDVDIKKGDNGFEWEWAERSNSIDNAAPHEWDLASRAIKDAVDHPPHYNKGNIETIEYIVDVLGKEGAINYCYGNILKYTGTRLHEKGKPVEDARKAIWYLNKLVELLESK